MADHRDGARVANALFATFQGMTLQQQTIMGQLLKLPLGDTGGLC